jgi:uncharacterized protein (TIGR02588 family)
VTARSPKRDEIPALEWVAAAIGAVLLVGVVGFMLRQAIVVDGSAGPITFVVKEVRPVGARYLVEFEARNGGSAAYAELGIEGTLRGPGGRVERAEATLDYLPGGSTREAGMFFEANPAEGELVLAPKGFRAP